MTMIVNETNKDIELKNYGFNVRREITNNGFKLSENMIKIVCTKISNTLDVNKLNEVKNLIDSKIGKSKFDLKNGFDPENKKHIAKLANILKRENAFSDSLGKDLLDAYNIKPERIIIFEDNENSGRMIKEKTIFTNGTESFLYFIPTFNSKDQYIVDEDIKKFNRIANNKYDLINGRSIS